MNGLSGAFNAHAHVLELTRRVCSANVVRIAEAIIECLRRGNKVILCGNGGSAADCQHIAAELVGRFERERRGLPAIALTTDTSILTAISNDYEYASVFSRQVEALARPGDIVIGISTSGNSANVVRALQAAKMLECVVVGFTGSDGGRLGAISDVCIQVPSDNAARIQEMHILIGHILCALVDEASLW